MAIYKHKGNVYEVLNIGKSKIPFREKEPVVVYRDEFDGEVYVRFLDEFKSKFKKVEG